MSLADEELERAGGRERTVRLTLLFVSALLATLTCYVAMQGAALYDKVLGGVASGAPGFAWAQWARNATALWVGISVAVPLTALLAVAFVRQQHRAIQILAGGIALLLAANCVLHKAYFQTRVISSFEGVQN